MAEYVGATREDSDDLNKTTIFLDWVNTLVRMEPDRHTMCVQALSEIGIDMEPHHAIRGILAAEQQIPEGRPIQWTDEQDPAVFAKYNDILMRTAGMEPLDPDTTLRIVRRVREMAKSIRFALFDDVLTALSELKQRGLTTAVLSNMNRPLQPAVERLGLSELLDFSLTSSEVGGTGKPEKSIFLEALRRATAEPAQAVHVGDEPWIDGDGAQSAGITPVIIDRWNLSTSTDYPRITSLQELPAMLDTFS